MTRSWSAVPILLLTVAIVVASPAFAANEKVVLVANHALAHDDIKLLVVRKVFLGLTTRVGKVVLQGLRNASDPRLEAIFLQSVVAMSERAYDHRLLTQMLQSGAPFPIEVTDEAQLVRIIENNPGALSFMWYDDAIKYPSIKIVRVIWQSD